MSDLRELKVGDRCCYENGPHLFTDSVLKITPSGRIYTKHRKWNKDGTPRGAGDYSQIGRLMPITKDLQDRLIRNAQISRLKYNTEWAFVDNESLHKIIGILNLSKEVKQ